jgi:SAM-dependent methyltransferase
LPVKNQTLLDIGAGAGIFAEVAAENGWNVTAIDPALEIGNIKNNPMLKKIKGTMKEIPKGDLFDIVTLWDVIEHTTDPIELISNAKQKIQGNGWLVIETGNYKGADRVNGGMSHWMYQHDHRWYFSPESIRNLLKDAGFCEFIFSDKVLRPSWNGSTGYTGPSKLSLVKSIIRDPINLPRHVSKHMVLTRAKSWEMSGIDIFAVASRKPNMESKDSLFLK